MKIAFSFTLYLFFTTSIIAQITNGVAENRTVHSKPSIGISTFDKWLSIRPTWVDARVNITNNGKYVFYNKRENWRLPSTFVVQSTNEDWKLEFRNVEKAAFTQNSQKIVFTLAGDSLCLLTLKSSTIKYFTKINSFKLFHQGETEWLSYLLNTPGKDLVLHNLETGKEYLFTGVNEYFLGSNAKMLVLKREIKQDNILKQTISHAQFPGGAEKIIWEGSNASNFVFDGEGSQLAFQGEDKHNNESKITFWYYKKGASRASQMANDSSEGIDQGLKLSNISKFSKNEKMLFIYITGNNILQPNPHAVKVDVWSYVDAKLQSQQLNEGRWSKNYIAVLNIENKRIIRLQQDDDVVMNMDNDDFILMMNRKGDEGEAYWNATASGNSYLVATSNGARKALSVNIPRIQSFSPDGRYLVGLDQEWRDIYSYDLTTGATRNLTKSLPVPSAPMIERDEWDRPAFIHSRGLGFLGWTDSGYLLISDEYDIWRIDPSGNKLSVNITRGYGQKNKIRFRLAAIHPGIYSGKTISEKGELFLTAFDKKNKNSGFYKIDLHKDSNPEILSMGPYYYEQGYKGSCQVKARDAEMYVVMRESASESPNYFKTTDFRSFVPLSSVYPEKNYNWLTSELISFKTLDNRIEQAVIYKPENFDPKKKYPVIIHYYEGKSHELNTYHKPAENNGELDIAWFASHGYVVVTPDIHFKLGEPGESALNSVEAVAKFLTSFSWIDAKRIGIQGHSFGGYHTNYIVTLTNRFAAAVSSSGVSDQVSNYGSLWGGGGSRMGAVEVDQHRMASTLWERPDLYIKNSPLFKADKVVTPILTIANKKDGNVPFAQGLQWFLALRRLGKKAWMLQYDEGSHGLSDKEYKDYVIRSTQFFDHYLKGAPAAKWMTQGIPAKLKGIDDGLELDNEIKTPGEGLLTPDQKKKIEALKSKKPVTIVLD